MDFYHGAKNKTSNDRVLDGDGGELELPDLAGEGLREGAERVLTDVGEYRRPRYPPQRLRLRAETLQEAAAAAALVEKRLLSGAVHGRMWIVRQREHTHTDRYNVKRVINYGTSIYGKIRRHAVF